MHAYTKNPLCLYTERQNCDTALKQHCVLTEWDSKVAKTPLKIEKPFFKVPSLSLPVYQLHLRTKNDLIAQRNDTSGTDLSDNSQKDNVHSF